LVGGLNGVTNSAIDYRWLDNSKLSFPGLALGYLRGFRKPFKKFAPRDLTAQVSVVFCGYFLVRELVKKTSEFKGFVSPLLHLY
jgi:hypothetical protein